MKRTSTPMSLPLSLAILLVFDSGAALAAQGPSSSANPYLQGVAPGVAFTSILTTGDKVGGYAMAGLPDGLGAYDNFNGTFTLLMNHEMSAGVGAMRSHGAMGAFVSQWVINKSTLQVLSGSDLIQRAYAWNSVTQSSSLTASAMSFANFCSADLPPTTAYAYTGGLGTNARIFMGGEEGGTGRAFAHVATGPNQGSSYELGKFNTSSNGSGGNATGGWENLLANPYAQASTVVIGNNDGGTGVMRHSLAVYVGTKTNSGSDADRAGLTNGTTQFVQIPGVANEINDPTSRSTAIANGVRFGLSSNSSTAFSRPEDGAWNPSNPREYYFVTTDQLDRTELTGGTQKGGTRLWRLTFDDLANVAAGGKIEILLDASTLPGGVGVDKPNMFDNMTVNEDGSLSLQEDPGGSEHNAKVWHFDPVSKQLVLMAKFDPALFGDVVAGSFVAGSRTQNEESSGVIDITSLLGRNDGQRYHLMVAQDHSAATDLGLPADLVQGGQLLLMSQSVTPIPEPATYALMLAGLGALLLVTRRRRIA